MFSAALLTALALSSAACSGASDEATTESTDEDLKGPGRAATDSRVPELGSDLRVLGKSHVGMAEAVASTEAKMGPVIEAKFELNDEGNLSLSLYPAGKTLKVDAERNVFQELAGDPTVCPFSGATEVFADQEHLTRSARDLTLVQLSKLTITDAINRVSDRGFVYWAIPTIRNGRAGYGLYTAKGSSRRYFFVDGEGSAAVRTSELGNGPGALATDERAPELGTDLSVLKGAKVTMAQALAQTEATNGPAIEAKYEVGDDGKLSLSVYPVKDLTLDAERASFGELAGDPTQATFAPSFESFKVPDVEHLTRSARDLTLVQTSRITLREAVDIAQSRVSGGFVYWAIPTIRDTRAGYGVYVYGSRGGIHYFFIS